MASLSRLTLVLKRRIFFVLVLSGRPDAVGGCRPVGLGEGRSGNARRGHRIPRREFLLRELHGGGGTYSTNAALDNRGGGLGLVPLFDVSDVCPSRGSLA